MTDQQKQKNKTNQASKTNKQKWLHLWGEQNFRILKRGINPLGSYQEIKKISGEG